MGTQDSNAGHVLRRHGDEEKRQRYPQQGVDGEGWRDPYRTGELPVDLGKLQLAPQGAEQHAGTQDQHHGVAGPEVAPKQECQQRGAKQQGILWGDFE
ncbi:hypothetical protein D3C85_826980 [compost metagenome]